MTRWKWTAAVLCCAVWGLPGMVSAATVPVVLHPNHDLLVTTSAVFDMSAYSLGFQNFVAVPLNTFDFGGSLGLQDVARTDTIIRRNSGATLTTTSDSFTTSIDIVALSHRSENQLDLGAGLAYYYVSLGSGPTSGSMTINGDGTWTNNFSFNIDLHRDSSTGPVDVAGIPVNLSGSGRWERESGPFYSGINAAVIYDPESDGDFYIFESTMVELGLSPGSPPSKTHGVIRLYVVPEPSTGLLLLAGGLAVVWRTRRSRVAA